MRTPLRVAAVLAAALLTSAAPATSALAAAATSPSASPAGVAAERGEVVGGSELGSTGVVVASGAPGLPDVAAASWLVADLDTGEVLAAKDPHGRYAPASTIKTLTALALIPELPADRTVTATYDDVAVDGSKVGIVERVDYPVSELFSALLMVSGNDAANVLASAAGGQQRAAALMNETAAELGALDTHAVNPHGLDAEGQVSSAYDLALIARAGLGDPDFARYVSTMSSSISAPGGTRIAMRNKNKLLASYDGALGVKNGYTNASRASFVGAAERDGRRLVVTLMRAEPRVFDEAVKLLDWGFAATTVDPVGVLVVPEPTSTLSVQDPASRLADGSGSSDAAPSGTTASAAAAPPAAREADTGLPVTLAGLGLVAAALLAVRSRPAPARAGGRRPPPRSNGSARPPAQRRTADAPRQRRTSEPRAPRPAERRTAPQRPVDRRSAPQRLVDRRSAPQRPVERRSSPERPVERRSAERRR